MIKKVLFISMMAASVGGAAVPAAAAIYVQVGPPEMRVEAVPAPRHGYVWAPGYWNYRGNQHVWAKGTWVHERPGYAYHSPKWGGTRWALVAGTCRLGASRSLTATACRMAWTASRTNPASTRTHDVAHSASAVALAAFIWSGGNHPAVTVILLRSRFAAGNPPAHYFRSPASRSAPTGRFGDAGHLRIGETASCAT